MILRGTTAAIVCLLGIVATSAGPLRAGAGTPRSRPAAALAQAIAGIQRTLAEIRGHSFKRSVPVATMTEAEVRRFLAARLSDEYPDERIADEQKTYVHFGLLKPGEDLKALFIQMLTDQAAGFYDPEEGKLFLISGRPSPGMVLVHEMAHVLQDQIFDVDSIIDAAKDDDDALLAVQAMIEGEAMTLASRYAARRSDGTAPERNAEPIGEKERDQGRLEESFEGLGKIPDILQANLSFPYTQGMLWANSVLQIGGEKMMDSIFRMPPESTEQIMHPEKFRPSRDLPSRIEPGVLREQSSDLANAGYRTVKVNTLGEFNIGQLFGADADGKGAQAAEGWDGDRYGIYDKPGAGTAMVWISAWDSADDAAQFNSRTSSWLAQRHPRAESYAIGTTGPQARLVYIVEGFESSLTGRLREKLQGSLASRVTFR